MEAAREVGDLLRGRSFVLSPVEDRRDFFDSTSSAAVSARARSLRSRSRSSSLMRLRSCLVACGLARASSGSASAAVQLARHLSNSAGYTPCSRHHALFARLAHRRRGDHRLKPRACSPGPPSGGPGLRILAPPLQCSCTNTNFPRNQLQRRALRRQQPRYRSVLECLSVSSQVRPFIATPRVVVLSGRQLF